MADRILARKLIEEYVPLGGLPYHSNFSDSDRRHNEIINRFQLPNGRIYSEYGGFGYGTTCGYLCQWLLFRLGLTDTNVLNRTTFRASVKPNSADFDDFNQMRTSCYSLPKKRITKNESGKSIHAKPADEGIHFKTFYEVGQNLSKMFAHGLIHQVDYTNFEDLKRIQYGDIGLIKGAGMPQKDKTGKIVKKDGNDVMIADDHVFVIQDFSINEKIMTFRTVESGQNSRGGDVIKDVQHKTRIVNIPDKDKNSEKQIKVIGDSLHRSLVGFLSLDKLTFDAPKIEFDEWPIYDPYFAQSYYYQHGINSISIPTKKYK
jgi:hypothetical protein